MSREQQRQKYADYLAKCARPQGKVTNWPEKKINEWVKLLSKLENNDKFTNNCGASSVFDITNYEEACEVYEKMQAVGLAGSKNGYGDNHCQMSAPFLAYVDMLLNERYYKYHSAKGEVVSSPVEESYIVKQCFNLLKSNRNLILTGAPGTGKTFMAEQIAQLFKAESEKVQFHPSYDYTDFVEGLRPRKTESDKEVSFVRNDGLFKCFCKKALKDSNKNYVFIIDEINRGEISKILGELFFSIDPEYRGERGCVQTQYQNMVSSSDEFSKGFFVPENVYIIATMNDIDRSVESMDFAIRRRFAWKEITYDQTMDAILDSCQEISKYIGEVYQRLENLNNAILNSQLGLSSAYQLGASYFTKLKNYEDVSDINVKFDNLWQFHIKGVLFEYLRGSEDPVGGLQLLSDAYYLRTKYNSKGEIVEILETEEIQPEQ